MPPISGEMNKQS